MTDATHPTNKTNNNMNEKKRKIEKPTVIEMTREQMKIYGLIK